MHLIVVAFVLLTEVVHKRVVVTCGDKVLFNRKKIKLAPGEMENVIIKAADIAEMTADQEIVVSIEEA